MRLSTCSLLISLALAAPTAALAQLPPAPKWPVVVTNEAQARFKTGVELLNDPDGGRYEEAYRAFRDAYELSPSWKILGNLALCAMKLERNGEALEAYDRYLATGGKDIDAAERAQIEKDMRLMRASSATVAMRVASAGGKILELEDRRTKANGTTSINVYRWDTASPLTLVLQAGRHVLTVRDGQNEARWDADLGETRSVSHDFVLTAASSVSRAPSTAGPSTAPPARLSTSTSSLRTIGYVTAGAGIVLLGVGAAFGLSGSSLKSDLERGCPGSVCPDARRGDVDTLKTDQTIANIGLIGGGVLAAAGVVMILVGKPSKENAAAATAWTLGAQVGPGRSGVVATGRF
jgi:hypothetical protein